MAPRIPREVHTENTASLEFVKSWPWRTERRAIRAARDDAVETERRAQGENSATSKDKKTDGDHDGTIGDDLWSTRGEGVRRGGVALREGKGRVENWTRGLMLCAG